MAINMNKFKQTGKVGAGLLNAASQAEINPLEKKMDIVYVSVDDIRPNKRNFYSQEEVDKRKESIEQVGLLEPLMVRYSKDLEQGTYTLLSGENRWRAISLLKQENKHSGVVPVIIKDIGYLEKLPLTDEEKEDLLIIEPNAQRRTNTEDDMLREVEKLSGIYKKLRRSGVEEINGQIISGKKTRELISEKTGLTEAQVEKYDSINRKAAPEVKAAVGEELNVNVAREIVKAIPDMDSQKKFMKTMEKQKPEEKITTDDVQKFVSENAKTNKKKNPLSLKEGQVLLNEKAWRMDTKKITGLVKKDIVLNHEKHERYISLIQQIEELLNGHEQRTTLLLYDVLENSYEQKYTISVEVDGGFQTLYVGEKKNIPQELLQRKIEFFGATGNNHMDIVLKK